MSESAGDTNQGAPIKTITIDFYPARNSESTIQADLSDTTSYAATVTTTATVTESGTSSNDGLPGQLSIGTAPISSSTSIATPGVTSSNPTSAASAAAETTSAAATATSSSSSEGYSAGEMAGAAVGSAIGGALLAFLITFFLCGRRGRSNRSQNRAISETAFSEKGSRSAGAVVAWQAYLPQSKDDGTLRNAVKTLFDQIELHVDNFYQARDARWDANTSQAVRQIDSGKLPAPIEELLQTPRTTLAGIKHCIAYDLVNSITPSSRPELSLLPPRLATLPPKLQEDSSISSRDSSAFRQAYSMWRQLNTFLFPNTKSDPAYNMDRDVSASDVADTLANVFLPWQSQQQSPEAAKQNSKGLAITAADLGVLIMSQASMYEFTWGTSSSRSGGGSAFKNSLVTFPGFLKAADDEGNKIAPPQTLLTQDVLKL